LTFGWSAATSKLQLGSADVLNMFFWSMEMNIIEQAAASVLTAWVASFRFLV
jgi:hypothetical protein